MTENLKASALVESIGTMASTYEERIADLRVDITNYSNYIKQQDETIESLREELKKKQEDINVLEKEAEGRKWQD